MPLTIDDVAVAAGSKTLTLVSVTQGGVTTPLNQALALDAAGRAQLTLTAAHLGELRFEATATDVNGNLSPTASVSVFVADPTNLAAPTAVIALPTDGQAVTEPVDVVGTVTDDVGIRDWQLTYTPLDGGQCGLIAEGTGAIDNGVLGRFDPTILRNGMYRLDLVVIRLPETTPVPPVPFPHFLMVERRCSSARHFLEQKPGR